MLTQPAFASNQCSNKIWPWPNIGCFVLAEIVSADSKIPKCPLSAIIASIGRNQAVSAKFHVSLLQFCFGILADLAKYAKNFSFGQIPALAVLFRPNFVISRKRKNPVSFEHYYKALLLAGLCKELASDAGHPYADLLQRIQCLLQVLSLHSK